jgi:cytochrome c-type biogenesis protein
MDYFITFLEGIVTFISPCLLPMLPVYVSYFAAQDDGSSKNSALINAIGFVMGFTIVFTILGAFAGTIGRFLREYRPLVNAVTGVIVILFGLNFIGVIKLPFINTIRQMKMDTAKTGFFSSILFGIVFSVGWTPCVGVFLGSAIMLAAYGGDSLKGVLMLLCYSLGLGIPFLASAVLIGRLKSAFDFIKKNYRIISFVSGGLLIITGILMATGLMSRYLSILSGGSVN